MVAFLYCSSGGAGETELHVQPQAVHEQARTMKINREMSSGDETAHAGLQRRPSLIPTLSHEAKGRLLQSVLHVYNDRDLPALAVHLSEHDSTPI